MDLQNKIALVTGSAKRVGKGIALALAQAGCDLVVHYRSSQAQARQTGDEIRALGRRCEVLQADLAQPEQIARLFEAVEKAFGRLDILVNNAATYRPTPLAALTAEQFDQDLAVNARAPALCMRHALPLMRQQGGAIVNITDVSASRGRGEFIAYTASKGALMAMTLSAAKALAQYNIRVNSISPGIALWPEDLPESERQRLIQQVPLKRAGSPELIAQAVIFLCQHEYITGEELRVDGGWQLSGR